MKQVKHHNSELDLRSDFTVKKKEEEETTWCSCVAARTSQMQFPLEKHPLDTNIPSPMLTRSSPVKNTEVIRNFPENPEYWKTWEKHLNKMLNVGHKTPIALKTQSVSVSERERERERERGREREREGERGSNQMTVYCWIMQY